MMLPCAKLEKQLMWCKGRWSADEMTGINEGNGWKVGNSGSYFFSSGILQISWGHNVPLLPSTIAGVAGKAEAGKQRCREASSSGETGISSGACTHQAVLSSCFFMVFVNLWQCFENDSCWKKCNRFYWKFSHLNPIAFLVMFRGT